MRVYLWCAAANYGESYADVLVRARSIESARALARVSVALKLTTMDSHDQDRQAWINLFDGIEEAPYLALDEDDSEQAICR